MADGRRPRDERIKCGARLIIVQRKVAAISCLVAVSRRTDLRPLALIERKALLRKLLPKDHPRRKYVDHLIERGLEMFKFAGMEGIGRERADSAYEGRRSQLCLKMKQAGFHDGRERPRSKPDFTTAGNGRRAKALPDGVIAPGHLVGPSLNNDQSDRGAYIQ